MTLSKEQMATLTADIVSAKGAKIEQCAAQWSADHTGSDRHYELLAETDDFTAWLLGWRPGADTSDHIADITPVHGHGQSAALVTVLKGEIDNDDYGLCEATEETVLGSLFNGRRVRVGRASAGSAVYVPKWGVHDMRCDERDGRGFAMTLHVYSPRLVSMTYFGCEPTGLRLTGTWDEVTGHTDGSYGTPLGDLLRFDKAAEAPDLDWSWSPSVVPVASK